MKTRLQELRMRAGYKSAKEFSDKHGISYDTYAAYENGKRNLSLAKAWELADMLGCTLDEIAGRDASKTFTDPMKQWLVDSYEECTTERKRRLVELASDQAAMSKEGAKSGVDSGTEEKSA